MARSKPGTRENSTQTSIDNYGFVVYRERGIRPLLNVARACASRAKDKTAFSVVHVGNLAGRIEIVGTTKTMTVRVLTGKVKVEDMRKARKQMAKRSKPTIGMKLEARRLRCKVSELGGGNLVDTKRIDRAIQSAATYAMMVERGRITQNLCAVMRRFSECSVEYSALMMIRNAIDGPLSGAPTKGAVKK